MNNIPKGYKQTEVGVMPEDWGVKKLGDIGSFSKGKGIRKDEVVSEGLPCIRYGEIYTTHNDYIKSFNSFITQSVANESVEIKKGDLLFAGSGETAEEIGKCVAFVGNERVFAGGDIVILRPSINNNSLFLGFLLNNQIVSRQKASMGQGDAVVHISGKNLSEIQIPLPPTKAEQTAIAAALSDADALITSLEKLIAKKRNIKQGAMQELLTGKKRLPEFSGKWEVKSLIELADNKKELFDDGDWIEAEYLTEDGIRLIQTGNIGEGVFLKKENKKYISRKSFDILRCKEIREGDILICRLAEPAGRACIMPNIGEDKMITAVDVSIFRPLRTMADRQYLVNVFSTNSWFNVVNEKCGGSTRTRIARGALGKIKLLLPPLPEQTAIAQILSDMDAEVEALGNKLEKHRQNKQGMMQELLTGKTRLI